MLMGVPDSLRHKRAWDYLIELNTGVTDCKSRGDFDHRQNVGQIVGATAAVG